LKSPVLYWNYKHNFVSFKHVSTLASKSASLLNIDSFLEFLGGQALLLSLIPMLLARLYYGLDSWTAFFVGLASLLGHMYPIFHGFKGGKGVATGFGVLLGISPLVAILSIALWGLVFKWKGIVSIASLSASAFAIMLLLLSYPFKIFLMALIMFLLILYRHKENIYRLMEGKEYKFKT